MTIRPSTLPPIINPSVKSSIPAETAADVILEARAIEAFELSYSLPAFTSLGKGSNTPATSFCWRSITSSGLSKFVQTLFKH